MNKYYTNNKNLIEKYGGYWFRNDVSIGIKRGVKDYLNDKPFGLVDVNCPRPVGWDNTTYAFQSNSYNRIVRGRKAGFLPNDEFSIRFKIKTYGSPHGGLNISPFISTINVTGNSGFMLGINGYGHICGHSRIKDSDGNVYENENVIGIDLAEMYIGDFQWHDILFVKEKEKITIYVDDFTNPAYITTKNIKPYKHSGYLTFLGSQHNTSSIYFNGMLDDIQIFHKPVHPIDLEIESYYFTDNSNNNFSVKGDTKNIFSEKKEYIFKHGHSINQTKIAPITDVIPDRLIDNKAKYKKIGYVVENKSNLGNGVVFKHKITDVFKTINLPNNGK